MGRNVEDIKKSMAATYEAMDESIVVDSGPINDLIITPISNELSTTEDEVAHIEGLISTEFVFNATQADVTAYINNFSMTEGSGIKSKGSAIFARFTKPNAGEIIPVPLDTLVSNLGGDLFYTTTKLMNMDGNKADSYYNATSGYYEIEVPIEAKDIGAEYDLPKFRIKAVTVVPGIDKVFNNVKIEGGQDFETIERQHERVTNTFSGLNLSSQGALIRITENYAPRLISNVTLIRSIDPDFTRLTTKNAIDIYVDGTENVTNTFTDIVSQPTVRIQLLNTPVVSVESFTVNGASVTYSIEKKKDGTENSTRETCYLVVLNELVQGDTIEIVYVTNNLIRNIQNDLFSNGEELCDFDILAKFMLNRRILITAILSISSSASESTVLANATNLLISTIVTAKLRNIKYKDIGDIIKDSIPEITTIKWVKFTSETGSLDVENIELSQNVIPLLLSTDLNLKIG